MTADDPRPAGEACSEPLCTTTLPHHVHSDADGRSWCCGPNPYTYRPAASGGATDGEACRFCGGTDGKHDGAAHDAYVANLPTPVASQADGELREGLGRVVRARLPRLAPRNDFEWGNTADGIVHAVLALPAVRQLLADAAAVQRARKLVAFYDRHEYSSLNVDDLREALDGDQ